MRGSNPLRATMNTIQIKDTIHSQLPFLAQKYHVKKMGIFGSVVRNEQNKNSDIDLLVDFSAPIGFFDFIRLENFLTKILKQKVDLVSTKGLKSVIKDDVLKETLYV